MSNDFQDFQVGLPSSQAPGRPQTEGHWRAVTTVIAACGCSCAALLVGFWFGTQPRNAALPSLLASSAASADSMAVATGPISDDSEGIFFLDYNTGDLQCLVYYPRSGAFGARYYANVQPQLGGGAGKNAKYLLVTGQVMSKSTTGGARPAHSLVYVTDVTSGVFAAYAIPWDRTAESSGRVQSGPMVYVGGGPIRNYQLNNAANVPPPAIVDPNQKR